MSNIRRIIKKALQEQIRRKEIDKDMVIEILKEFPLNKWENWGDVDFETYGGLLIKRIGNDRSMHLELLQVYPLNQSFSDEEIVSMIERYFDSEEEARKYLEDGGVPYLVEHTILYPEDIVKLVKENNINYFMGGKKTDKLEIRVFNTINGYIDYYGAENSIFLDFNDIKKEFNITGI